MIFFPLIFRKIYKSHIDSSDLYTLNDSGNNPIAEDMQRKLNVESERLRVRLRQELAELRERLSPSPALLGSRARERLAPLARELQRSLSGGSRDLCGRLSLHLRGPGGPTPRREALDAVSRDLERGGSEADRFISDFHQKSLEELQHLKEISTGEEEGAESELWREMSSRLDQEVSALKAEAREGVVALRAKLAAALRSDRPQRDELTDGAEELCRSSVGQNHGDLEARLERVFQGVRDSPEPSPPPPSGGSLTDDFTVRLSALIHDILHSV